MSYLSSTQLYEYRSKTKKFSRDNFRELNESANFTGPVPMVFLSHKHDEEDLLQGAIGFLKKEGVDIYVDWMDDDMPAYTNAETALKLKEKIKQSSKFILVATDDAINSKWCNWELGLGDAAKYIKDIALFPINKFNRNYKGAEYLRIYPHIEYEDGNNKYTTGRHIPKGYYVMEPLEDGNRKLIPLKEWLEN